MQWADKCTLLSIVSSLTGMQIGRVVGSSQHFGASPLQCHSLRQCLYIHTYIHLSSVPMCCLYAGSMMNIMAEELVPGDIIRLQSGDRVVGTALFSSLCMYVCMYTNNNVCTYVCST